MLLLHHLHEIQSLTVAADVVGLLGRLLSYLGGLRGCLPHFHSLISGRSLLLIFSGPTGTGKTLMAKTLAKILDVPFA
jgi:hypothetical protein